MLEPIGDKVLIEILTRAEAEKAHLEKSTSLLIPELKGVQGEPDRGVVYAISSDIEKPEYSIGDTVVFHSEDIFEGFKHDGKNLVAVHDFEILARIA